MSTMTRTGSLVMAAAALTLAGCSSSSAITEPTQGPSAEASASTPAPKAMAAIQLRSMTLASEGACSETALQAAAAGRACSIDAETTYQLGPRLADLVVTKAQVTVEEPGDISTGMPIVRVQLDKSSTLRLSTLTKEYVGKPMAFLIGGRVVQTTIISAQITDGDIAVLPGGSASDTPPPSAASYNSLLSQVASALGAQ
jgi:preprotein translocase subunit SecD